MKDLDSIRSSLEYQLGSVALDCHSDNMPKAELIIKQYIPNDGNNSIYTESSKQHTYIQYKNNNGGGGGQPYPVDRKYINDYAIKHYIQDLVIQENTIKLSYKLRKIKTGYRKKKKYLNVLNNLKEANTSKEFWDTYAFYRYYKPSPSDIHSIASIRDTIIYTIGTILNEQKQSWYKGDFYHAINLARKELDRFKKAIHLQGIIYDYMPSYTAHLFHNAVNFIDSSNDTLDFIQNRLDSIIAWVTSQDFKQYIESTHPYPPLLNPSTIDYHTLDPRIAFALNLPLPNYYDFVVCLKGLSGHYAFSCFLNRCLKLIDHEIAVNRIPLRNIDIYSKWYNDLLLHRGKKCALSRHYGIMMHTKMMVDNDKLLYLACSNKDIVYLVRDPISKLKSAINHTNDHIDCIDYFNLTFDPDVVVQHWCYYLTRDYPDMEFMANKYAALQEDWIGFNTHFTPIGGKVIYIDTKDITGKKTLETMRSLGDRFDFNVPNDEKFFLAKSGGALGYMVINGKKALYVHKNDLYKTSQDKSSMTQEGGYNIYFRLVVDYRKDGLIVVNNAFFSSNEWFDNVDIVMQEKDFLALEQHKELFNKTKGYLHALLIAIKKRVAVEEAKMVNEDDILQFIKRSGQLEYVKNLLSKEVEHIKEQRPDIVRSWKYYQKLISM